MSASNVQTKKIRQRELPSMPENRLSELLELLPVQSNSSNESMMVAYLSRWLTLKGLQFELDIHGNMYVVKGKADRYPCIVAHLDTVHTLTTSFNVSLSQKAGRQIAIAVNNSNKPIGIGGDDKCGIYGCLYMLEKIDNIKVAFFSQEERGCIGSSSCDIDWLKDVGYIIQLDRWGSSDLICKTYSDQTVSDEFLEVIDGDMTNFGYSPQIGLITDSINLWDNYVGVSCVNVSCGYYEHHTVNEKIDLNELWNSILFTETMIHRLGQKEYPSAPSKECRALYSDDYEDYDYQYGEYGKSWNSKSWGKTSSLWKWDAKTGGWRHQDEIDDDVYDEKMAYISELFYHSGAQDLFEFYEMTEDDAMLNMLMGSASLDGMDFDRDELKQAIAEYCVTEESMLN